MALEFICSMIIMRGEKIPIPPGANCYRVKSKKIKFFSSNPESSNMNKIPKNSKEMSFDDYMVHMHWVDYGKPTFYD